MKTVELMRQIRECIAAQPTGEKTVVARTLMLKYARELRDVPAGDLAVEVIGQPSFRTEISKMRSLAEFVEVIYDPLEGQSPWINN